MYTGLNNFNKNISIPQNKTTQLGTLPAALVPTIPRFNKLKC